MPSNNNPVKKHSANNWIAIAFFPSLFLTIAAATVFSNGAPSLSIWIILIYIGAFTGVIIAFSPAPTAKIERLCLISATIFIISSLIWPRYASLRLPGLPSLSLSRITLLPLILLFSYLVFKRKEFRDRLKSRIKANPTIFLPFFFLIIYKAIGISFSVAPPLALRGVANELLTLYIPTAVILAAVQNKTDIGRLHNTLLMGAALVILVALVEFALGKNVFLNLMEVDSDYLAEVLSQKMRGGAYRLQSTFSHPLLLSEFLVIVTPIAIHKATSNGFSAIKFLALLIFLTATGLVIFKTGSRSGIGTFLVVLGTVFSSLMIRNALREKRPAASGMYALSAAALVFSAVIGIFLIQDILAGRTASEIGSTYARVVMWRNGMTKAFESPLVGYGQDLGGFVLGFATNDGRLTIDSYYLSTLLDNGFPGLMLFILPLAAALFTAIKDGFRRNQHDLTSILTASSILAFLGIKSILSLPHNHIYLMIILALMIISIQLSKEETKVRESQTT